MPAQRRPPLRVFKAIIDGTQRPRDELRAAAHRGVRIRKKKVGTQTPSVQKLKMTWKKSVEKVGQEKHLEGRIREIARRKAIIELLAQNPGLTKTEIQARVRIQRTHMVRFEELCNSLDALVLRGVLVKERVKAPGQVYRYRLHPKYLE